MRISSLTLSNFRCFGPAPTSIDLDELTTLIGANGSGKSAVLGALLRLFGIRSIDRSLTRTDFYIPPGLEAETITDLHLTIEVKLEFPKLVANPVDPSVPECFRHMVIEAPGATPFCRVRLEGDWRRTAQAEGAIDENLFWVMTAADDPPDDSKRRMSNFDRSRIQVVYVPASRDPSGQLRHAAGTLLYPLLKAMRWSDNTRTTAVEAAKNVRDAVRSERGMRCLEKAVSDEWKKLQEFEPLREVQFQPLSPEFDTLLRRIEATFQPAAAAVAQPLERLSDGLRSLFYFALLGARFDLERMDFPADESSPFDFAAAELPSLSVFAIEEPENHLAPQYLARILVLLKRVSDHDGAQVLLTSHSPAILSRVEPETVRHLRLNAANGQARIKALVLPPLDAGEIYKYLKEAVHAYPELYFATGVILGEGDSETIVLPRVAAATGRLLDHSFISVVPLGGRHVNHFWRLLQSLEIPFVTLLDLDRERSGGGWGRIHYAVTQLIEFSSAVTLATFGITQQQLDDMPKGNVDELRIMQTWIDRLEQHGVFFCAPLDIDFSMLTAFPDAYHAATSGTGPRISAEPIEYAKRIAQVTTAVLKPDGGDGHTYTAAEQAEFTWYNYLFLGRGKPSTHILALNALTINQIRDDAPSVLTRLLDRMSPKPPPPPVPTR